MVLAAIFWLCMTPKTQATKADIHIKYINIYKWDYIKLKSFCTAKETIKK